MTNDGGLVGTWNRMMRQRIWDELRRSYAARDDEDRPAALAWRVDAEGMISLAPYLIDDAVYWGSRALEDEDHDVDA